MDAADHQDAAATFFHEIVSPTVEDFLRNRGNRRLGCLACLTLASMAEHYFHARLSQPGLPSKDPEGPARAYIKTLRQQFPGIGLVMDVANATKHVSLTRKPIAFSHIRSEEITTENMNTEMPTDGWEVMVRLNEGQPSSLPWLVEGIWLWWAEQLAAPTSLGSA